MSLDETVSIIGRACVRPSVRCSSELESGKTKQKKATFKTTFIIFFFVDTTYSSTDRFPHLNMDHVSAILFAFIVSGVLQVWSLIGTAKKPPFLNRTRKQQTARGSTYLRRGSVHLGRCSHRPIQLRSASLRCVRSSLPAAMRPTQTLRWLW